MNDQIRRAIHYRSRRARTKTQVVAAIFDSFRRSHVDIRKVSLEDMKVAVVVAGRAVRESGESLMTMPA